MWYFILTSKNYTEAARKFMRYRAKRDPKEAVGGWEQGIGELQLDFLTSRGLKPEHFLLDLGCGSLRAGRYFIDYLEPGHYTGMDISPEAIEEGKRLIDDDLLAENQPQLLINNDLQFKEFEPDETHDYIISQSVFTHLPLSEIEECFANVSKILEAEGAFYATYFYSERYDLTALDMYDYAYSEAELSELGAEYGLSVMALSYEAYPHPRDQRMLEITLK